MNPLIIAIFKAESNISETDPYVEAFKNGGFKPTLIPTLAFKFFNGEQLLSHLNHYDDFTGIIFSSTRAVEAVHKISKFLSHDVLSKWRDKLNYSVGESTSLSAKTLLQFDLKGKQCGSSEDLCTFILSTADSNSRNKSFLFPCSSVRKDTIPQVLSQNGIKVVEVSCYETVCNPSLTTMWNNLILEDGLPSVLVFFSPSGVKFSHQLIKDTFTTVPLNTVKIISIGKTTEKALEEVNLPPCKVSVKPNPESILEAVKESIIN